MRALAGAFALIALSACSRPHAPAAPQESTPAQASPAPAAEAPSQPAGGSPRATITLYFPSASTDTLVAETREIVDTARPAERGTQVLAALLEGPSTQGLLPAVPDGTTLRQLWIGKGGVAWADFSEQIASGIKGGSADELLTVYAVVDSLVANVPQIQRVGLLVEGRERDTLAGHVDVRRPLPSDIRKTP